MTNDEFDDTYDEHYHLSDDRAVREISGFCYSLYPSDLLIPLRLRGRHALDADSKHSCTRAVLFLRSGLEYEWPAFPDNVGLRILAGFVNLGIPLGIVFFLIGVALVLSGEFQFGSSLFIGGLAMLIGSLWFGRTWPKTLEPEWESFRESGNYDVWPFLHQRDFDHTNAHAHE